VKKGASDLEGESERRKKAESHYEPPQVKHPSEYDRRESEHDDKMARVRKVTVNKYKEPEQQTTIIIIIMWGRESD